VRYHGRGKVTQRHMGGAVTNIHLASQPGGPQMVSVRGAYDETVRMLKASHVSARAVAT